MRELALSAVVLSVTSSCDAPAPQDFAVYHGGGAAYTTYEEPFLNSADGMFIRSGGHVYDLSVWFDYILSDDELNYADAMVFRGLYLDDGSVKIGGLFCRVSDEFIDCRGLVGGVRAPRGGGESDTNVTRVHAFPPSP